MVATQTADSAGAVQRTIALVDDDRNILTTLSIALQTEGFATRVYADGDGALKALLDNPPDLAVCDIKMPRMDGFELLRRLRERAERVPVVMVTTRGSVSDRALAASLGADALIVKSEFENAHLLDTVRRFVEISA